MDENVPVRFGEVTTSWVLNPPGPATDTLTVPVGGVPRGGTTMVAAVLDGLGIDMGTANGERHARYRDFEDLEMIRASKMEKYDYITKRNREALRWGWKNPTGIELTAELLHVLRNPRMIIVFRDLLAVIQGELRFERHHRVIPLRPFNAILTQHVSWLMSVVDVIRYSQMPLFLVSYERAMLDPDAFLNEITAYLQIAPTEQQRNEARRRITTGGYLPREKVSGEI